MAKFRFPTPIRMKPHCWKVESSGTWSGLKETGLCIDLELWLERLERLDAATLPAIPAEGIPAGHERVPRLVALAQTAIAHRQRMDEAAALRRRAAEPYRRTYAARPFPTL